MVLHHIFGKLAEVTDRFKFDSNNIWNMDENGGATVLKIAKIVAEKGPKHIGTINSG